jgi:hypothetical protein
MTDLELATFGFRFTTREGSAPRPVEFIRTQSEFSEEMLAPEAVSLAGRWHEMNEVDVKISVHRLRAMLDGAANG